MAPEFLDRDAVLLLHDETLQDHGGIPGVKDDNLLDSRFGPAT